MLGGKNCHINIDIFNSFTKWLIFEPFLGPKIAHKPWGNGFETSEIQIFINFHSKNEPLFAHKPWGKGFENSEVRCGYLLHLKMQIKCLPILGTLFPRVCVQKLTS